MPAKTEAPIPVKVEGILMSTQGPVVMLAPLNGDGSDKLLPIFIDQGQALNIQLALKGELPPRPMTHDLFNAVLNELGAIVTKVVIEELTQNTFYASLYVDVERGGKREAHRFDARPSDCLALAVRVNARIEVARKVMDQAGIPRSEVGKPEDEADDEGEGGGKGKGRGGEGETDLGVSR